MISELIGCLTVPPLIYSVLYPFVFPLILVSDPVTYMIAAPPEQLPGAVMIRKSSLNASPVLGSPAASLVSLHATARCHYLTSRHVTVPSE